MFLLSTVQRLEEGATPVLSQRPCQKRPGLEQSLSEACTLYMEQGWRIGPVGPKPTGISSGTVWASQEMKPQLIL